MHLPEVDKYAHLDSPLHRWDARVKVACMVLMVVAVVLAPTHAAALVGLAAALCLVAVSRIPPAFVMLHLRWVLLMCLFLLIVLPLTAGGGPASPPWRLGPLRASPAGLAKATLISVRAVAAVLLIFVTVGTARFHVTLKALRRLRVPAVAVQILAFSYRYIFVLFDELQRMLSAARARGHGRARGLRRLSNMGNMLGMLFVRSLNRTARVHHAMLARGYRGDVKALDDFRLGPADVLKGLCAVAVAAALFAWGVRA